MKNIILTCLLFLLVLASCDSPISNVSDDKETLTTSGIVTSEIPPGTLPAEADSIRKAIWQQFKDQNGSKWQIRWNERTGLPVSIFSGLTEKTYPGNAEQAARSFLGDHGALFGFENLSRLQHVKTQTHRGIRHVTFNQTVKGVPVYEAEYKVHLRSDGKVDMVNGIYYPNVEVSTNPSISKAVSIEAAGSDIELPQGAELQSQAELVIYPTDKQFRLAWNLVLFSQEPVTGWSYMVDAHSGEVLYKLNQLTNVTGDGDVYPTHPGLSSVTNFDLYRLSGNGRLQGTYAYVVNDEVSEAYSSNHSFQYSPSNVHFDEVNLYYHIDNFRHNFIEGIDDGSLGFTQIKAHAHTPFQDFNGDGFPDPNAWFDRNSKELYFNDEYAPQGTESFAKEDKIVHHEYGHAVIYDIQSGIQSTSSEEGAISEGTPDYFAGSFTNRSIIIDYAAPFYERDMANPEISSYLQYENERDNVTPIGDVPPHNGGEFFSAVLWDLQSRVGASATDFLVYDALYRITGGPDFLEFRDGMIGADGAAYSGDNSNTIQNTFADWGIRVACSTFRHHSR